MSWHACSTIDCSTRSRWIQYIETESFEGTFNGLFSEINLAPKSSTATHTQREAHKIIRRIAEGLEEFSADKDNSAMLMNT